ncbi:hypothetical protein [Streptomyces pristinaespiralis]|uniref:hypothetical protein n=1 Tax=Streptomyces pristinaespiralis TaxID=38300 RepID=UPI0033E15A6E
MVRGSATVVRSASPWHRLARPTDRRRALWGRGSDSTRWVECGGHWDAVAITPMVRGLDALAAMRLGPRSGYPVLADVVRDVLYVLVPSGTGNAAASLPGVRVLTTGNQLLLPATDHGTPAAHWISPPREVSPRLVRADRLTRHLRALTGVHEEAAVS